MRRDRVLGILAVVAIAVAVAFGLASGWGKVSTLTAWVVSLLALGAFLMLAGGAVTGYALGALIDDRDKVSLSRFQLVLWTLLLLSALLTAGMHNLVASEDALAIELPEQLFWLLGISTTSLVGSPLIKGAKKERTAANAPAAGSQAVGLITKNATVDDASWADMFRGEEVDNDQTLDLAKIQMFFFTIVIGVVYAFELGDMFREAGVMIGRFPAISEGMNILLGLSHTGYLTHKAVPLSKEQ